MAAKREKVAPINFGLMKYVHVTYFFGAVITGWLLVKLFDNIWTFLNLTFAMVPPPRNVVIVLAGVFIASGSAFYLWKHPRVNRLVVEIVNELSKVIWPTRKELVASTIVVIIFSIIASIILGLFDFFWSNVTDLIYL